MFDFFAQTYLVEGLHAIGERARRMIWLTVPSFMMAGALMAGEPETADGWDGDAPSTEAPDLAGEVEIPRDPFWPVGYTPPKPVDPDQEPEEPGETEAPEAPEEPEAPEIEPPDWEAAVERIVFQGRFEGRGRILASVNGRIVEQDSVLGVRLPPYVYYFRIVAIRHDGVKTEPVEAIPIE